jgi:hypothetical protein
MENVGRIIAFAMGINYLLLAYQVETNITSVLGYIFGSMLCLAVLMSFVKPKRYPSGRGDKL